MRARRGRRRPRRLWLERLEDRCLLATLVVNSVLDLPDSGHALGTCDTELNPDSDPPIPASGICTLRAAISSVAENPGLDAIHFAIPGTGVPTIDVGVRGMLTVFGGPVVLDATTQGAGTVELRGASGIFNLSLGTSGSTIRGFTFNSAAGGIAISNSHNNRIVGNRFGTDPTGTISLPLTATAIGIWGNNNTIGGTTPEDRNVIASSGIGVDILSSGTTSTGNMIRGNYIGTDVTGAVAMGHSDTAVSLRFAVNTTIEGNVIAASPFGVSIGGSTGTGNVVTGNLIGTDVSGLVTDPDGQVGSGDELGNGKGILVNDAPGVIIANNVIAGSTGVGVDFGYGVHLANPNASGAAIRGNMIGVNAVGKAVLANKSDGVFIERAGSITIGGTADGDRNVISGNGGDGVTIYGSAAQPAANNTVLGNYIGVDGTGEFSLGNASRGVHIDSSATGNIIGGDSPAARNIISGNGRDGVIIALGGATNNVVKGNYIGTDKDGVSDLGNGHNGVYILRAPNNIIGQSSGTSFVRNLISGNARNGVLIDGFEAVGNVVAGNLIGTNKDGTSELPNDLHGVYLFKAPRNRIGDVFAGLPSDANFPGNVIAARQAGVRIEGVEATRNEVLSNLIGVDITGTNGWPTVAEVGVHLLDAPNNRIGIPNARGTTPGGNTISNSQRGIHIQAIAAPSGTGTLGGIVGGNFIGTDRHGSTTGPAAQLGNRQEGVFIENASNSYIGGQPTGEPELPANIIAGNGGDGVRVTGENGKGNTIQGNSIVANGLLGIDLGGDGVTANDADDADLGPNNFQNSPFVTRVVRADGSREILGTLSSKPNTRYRVELFAGDEADSSGFGEGQTRVGFLDNVTTDGLGAASFQFDGGLVDDGRFITATAGDPSGNTSEFSCATRQAVSADSSVFGVTNTHDRGVGSLRQAILDANGHPGLDTIVFCLAGTGPQTIIPETALPPIADPAIIDGTTQTGASCNTQLDGGQDTKLLVELNGSNPNAGPHGLHIMAGGSTVRGLVINRFGGSGILLEAGGGNHIECNLIGTDPTGLNARENLEGVTIQQSADNLIGGSLPETWNVISGNVLSGVTITGAESSGNHVRGNFIGINLAGNSSLPNTTGVRIADASNNVVGGSAQNVISGNRADGVLIVVSSTGGVATNNVVLNNRIGTNPEGTVAHPNMHGVTIFGAGSNRVGGSSPAFIGNLISGNLATGITIEGADATANIVVGNLIGTDADGTNRLANGLDGVLLGAGTANNRIGGLFTRERNIISGNDGHGIRISGEELQPARDNIIRGNYIGTNVTGTSPVHNAGSGLHLAGFTRNTAIGGEAAGAGNVISGNTTHGVAIAGPHATLNQIIGNHIGVDPSGTQRVRNEEAGVMLDGAPQNTVGLAGVDFSNVISGNAIGVYIKGAGATGNRVLHNLLGTDVHGTAPLGNDEAGVRIESASLNDIGGAAANEGNVISANSQFGVHVLGPNANQNFVGGNSIGTDPQGTAGADPEFAPLGNVEAGVLITDATQTRVGVAAAMATVTDACAAAQSTRNTIANNQGVGVRVAGASAAANVIRCNVIRDNEGIGIDLVGNDTPARPVTGNDPDDADAGPHGLLNFPVGVTYLTNPTTGEVTVLGSVRPGANVIVDLYGLSQTIVNVSEGPDPLGFGEGEIYLGSVVPPPTGDFSFALAHGLPAGFPFVSATATNIADGSTSEFSAVCGYLDADNDGNPDTDGDSLCDDWETDGIDYNGDGIIDLNLPALTDSKNNPHQADPLVRDIFVEVDWMDCAVGGCAANHASHEPVPAALDEVTQAFGKQNIQLHLMPDESLREITSIRFNSGAVKVPPDGTFNDLKVGNPENRCGTGASDGHFGTPAERAAVKPDGTSNCENILGAREQAFRYLIFGHDHAHAPKSSGIAELPGNDFMVTLGSWSANAMQASSGLPAGKTTDEYRSVVEASTIMHEMGHTLNLRHGGGDETHCKPNYLSVMNYSLQLPSKDPTRPLDYSDTALAELDEEHLNEALGIGGPPGRFVVFGQGFSATRPAPLPAANGPLDWNGDGDSTDANIDADINMSDRVGRACGPRAQDSIVQFENLPDPETRILGNTDYSNNSSVGLVLTMLTGAARGEHRVITGIGVNPRNIFVLDFNAPIAVGDQYVIHRSAEKLAGYDDWEHLLIPFRHTVDYADGLATTESEDEATVDDFVAAAMTTDFDGDGFANAVDNCPAVLNPAQADTNGDGVADACSAGIQVFVSGGTLHYVAVASQVNRAVFSPQAGSAVVGETTELILETGQACSGGGAPSQAATCSLAGVARIAVTLDDGDDRVELGRFDLPVRIHAGLGDDSLRLTGTGQTLDLVALADSDWQGLETIDIQGNGPNSLALNAEEVSSLSDTGELRVLANLDDSVNVGQDWLLSGVTIEAGLFFRVLEQDSAKLLLSGPADWSNPINLFDVNADGPVDPQDVLIVINELNGPRFHDQHGLLADAASLSLFPGSYFDVDADGLVEAQDVLIIINFLNNRSTDPEGEAVAAIAADRDRIRDAALAEWASPIQETFARPLPPRLSPTVQTTAAREREPCMPCEACLEAPPPEALTPSARKLPRAEYAGTLDDLLAEFESEAWAIAGKPVARHNLFPFAFR